MTLVSVIVGLPQWYLQTASVFQHRGGSFFIYRFDQPGCWLQNEKLSMFSAASIGSPQSRTVRRNRVCVYAVDGENSASYSA